MRARYGRHSLDAVQQPAPSIEGLPAREASLQHRAGVLAHGRDAFGVRGQQHEGLGKRVGVAGLDDKAAGVLLHQARDFSILRGDRDDRTTGGRNAVKLARDDKAFELGPQRYLMYVRGGQRVFEQRLILIGR